MNKQKELFKKYNVNESHNVWESIDSWMSVEIYRLMHNGKLPPINDDSVNLVTDFLDKIKSEPKWWGKIMSERTDWGSLFLTAKRMVYMLKDKL